MKASPRGGSPTLPLEATKPLMRQYLQIKRKYPDCILFFRLGDFYEMFLDDAITAARELDLVLTSREKDEDQRVPMCGVPWFAAEGYIARLVRRGYKVAICEQMEAPTPGRRLVRREVVRILTPGTFLGDEGPESAYLAGLALHRDRLGVAFLHVADGEVVTCEIPLTAAAERLSDLWSRFPVSEVLYPEGWSSEQRRSLQTPDGPSVPWTPVPDWVTDPTYARELCRRVFQVDSLAAFDLEDRPAACAAVGMVLHYLEETQRAPARHVRTVRHLRVERSLVLDAATVRNLELVRNLADGTTHGTLFGVLNHTQTPMGSRLLMDWILQPLQDREAIERRLDAVEALVGRPADLEELRRRLRPIPDLPRIIARIGVGTATPRDLARLREGLVRLPAVWTCLQAWPRVGLLEELVEPPGEDVSALADELCRALVDDPPTHPKDGGFIRDGYDPELDRCRAVARDSRRVLLDFERRERQRTGIPNLRVGYNRVFGYYIEVTRSYLGRVPPDYERRQTLTQAERFTTPELRQLEEQILTAEERALALEQDLFRRLLEQARACIPALQRAAERIARLDVLATLAYVALRHRYVRPHVHEGTTLEIRGGRHPVLETLLTDRTFVPNDTRLDPADQQIIVLTGPNMGGKSTYLRQVALICLMAQMGSFVPADSASIGLVDRIFTRVGATDHLSRGQSTFMVEMIETASIVRNATPRSLIILDEIGRGTSTFDGMAIAWAVLEYLHEHWQPGPRVLFATHFHELVHLADLYPRVRNYAVAVHEGGDGITFLYRIVPGPSDKSYGVHVARRAGLPDEVVRRAQQILRELEGLEKSLEAAIGRVSSPEGTPVGPLPAMNRQAVVRRHWPTLVQPTLLTMDARYAALEKLAEELLGMDLDAVSPRQAWEFLERWQKRLRKGR